MDSKTTPLEKTYTTLSEAGNLAGKRVLIRLDLNVPIVNGMVRDDFRIRKALPTLEYLKQAGARTLILAHIESPETKSLEMVAKYMNMSIPVTFARSIAELS